MLFTSEHFTQVHDYITATAPDAMLLASRQNNKMGPGAKMPNGQEQRKNSQNVFGCSLSCYESIK